MRFAKYTFIGAGVWGLAVLLPFFALVDITGRRYMAPSEHPQFFWGFFTVAIAWQIAFLMIGTDPMRFRPFMLPAVLEKGGFVTTLIVLFSMGRISTVDLQAAFPDGILAIMFALAFFATRPRRA